MSNHTLSDNGLPTPTREALLESEQLFRCVFDTVADGILVADTASGAILLVNAALCRLLGRSQQELLSLSITDLHPRDASETAREAYASMARGELRSARLPLLRQDGTSFNAELGSGLMDSNGHTLMVCTLRDLSTHERAELAEQLARHDELTGLHNHRAFQQLLTQELARAQRHGTPLSLLMVDIDHFKQVNDTLGHEAGNAVLRQLAGLLQDGARNIDHVCRYGGEEFVLILPMATTAEALPAAERLRQLVGSFEFDCGSGSGGGREYRRITVSIGVAGYPQHALTQAALVAAADTAMYDAKHAGRNCCRVFNATAQLPPA